MKIRIAVLVLVLLISINLFAGGFGKKGELAHFSGSMFLYCWSNGFSEDVFSCSRQDRRILAAGFSFSLGIIKEAKDAKTKEWSWYDLFWDAMGIGCGMVLVNNGLI